MSGMMAYCGLECQACPIHVATRVENKGKQARLRAKIAQLAKEQYGMPYEPEDITDCDGCRAEGRLFSGCIHCPIRNCAKPKGIENCAYCADYACEKLAAFFDRDPAAKMRLDEIKLKTL